MNGAEARAQPHGLHLPRPIWLRMRRRSFPKGTSRRSSGELTPLDPFHHGNRISKEGGDFPASHAPAEITMDSLGIEVTTAVLT